MPIELGLALSPIEEHYASYTPADFASYMVAPDVSREDDSHLEASFGHYEDHMVGACDCTCESDRTCTHIA